MQPHLFKIALKKDILPDLTKDTLHDLGIDVIWDILSIIKQSKQQLSATQLPQAISPTQALVDLWNFVKAPAAQLPVSAKITLPQFQKFRMDWNVFKHITNITVVVMHMLKIVLLTLCLDFFTLWRRLT